MLDNFEIIIDYKKFSIKYSSSWFIIFLMLLTELGNDKILNNDVEKENVSNVKYFHSNSIKIFIYYLFIQSEIII